MPCLPSDGDKLSAQLKLLKMLKPPQAFPEVDLRSLVFNNEHARRFLISNTSDQIGLFMLMETRATKSTEFCGIIFI